MITCKLVSVAFALVLMNSRAAAQPPVSQLSITMDVAPARGTMDDVFELTVRIALPGGGDVQRYQEPGLDEFRVLARARDDTTAKASPGAGASAQRVVHHRYTLAPKRNGLLRIEPARVRVDERTYQTSARVVEVVSALDADDADDADDVGGPGAARTRTPMDPSPKDRQPLTPPALPADRPPPEIFVHASVDREVAYVGQQVTVTWVLYTRHELIEFEPEIPRLDDFWTEILYEPSSFVRQGEVFLAGMRYQVVVVSRRALFPLRPGRLSIEPYRARASGLYTPLGSHAVVHSQGLEIRALPLPAGAPAGFDDSYVGLFKVSASIDRTTVPLGEPLLLGVSVRGHGAIRRTTPPPLAIEGFDVERVPDFQESVHATDRTAIGVREYRYWLTPRKAGTLTIPAIRIPYFDPRTGTYESALSQALTVAITDVARGGARSEDEAGSRRTANARSSEPRAALRWWIPAAALALAALCFGLAWYVRARQERVPGGLESPRVRLRQAEHYLADARFREFFGELAAVLERALQERLDTPVRPLTREQWLAALEERGVHRDVIGRVREQLEECDLARFASSRGNADEMREALQRVRELLRELEHARPEHAR